LSKPGFDRSKSTPVRELRRLQLLPNFSVCEHRRGYDDDAIDGSAHCAQPYTASSPRLLLKRQPRPSSSVSATAPHVASKAQYHHDHRHHRKTTHAVAPTAAATAREPSPVVESLEVSART
jgi:hypothetical protein